LVDALSFTEAEGRIIEEIKPYISGEFTIADIKRVKYAETFSMLKAIAISKQNYISSRWTRKAEAKRKLP